MVLINSIELHSDTDQEGFGHNVAITSICVYVVGVGRKRITIRNITQHETHYMRSALQTVKHLLRFSLFPHGLRITNSSSQQKFKAKIDYHAISRRGLPLP